MSSAPTSVAEGNEALALLAAGWQEAELTWERLQERAAEAAQSGDRETAVRLWAEALALARETFEAGDPRLATSLTNQGAALVLQGEPGRANPLFREALLVWDASGPWVAALAPERRARSSTFHLRLAGKNPGQWDPISRERYAALAAEGRAATQAWTSGRPAGEPRLTRWRQERPAGFSDARKLLAAALLIAPGPTTSD